jgi:hypothetical protein
MKQLLAAAAILTGLSAPASATEWVICSGGEGHVSFDVLLGLMDVIAIDTVKIEINGKTWSNKPEAGTIKVEIGQAFETADQMWIDVVEDGMGSIIAKLRLFSAHEDGEGVEATDAMGGTLQMPGVGAWAVTCSGP